MRYAFWLTQVKIFILMLVPFAAWAVEQNVLREQDDLSSIALMTWFFLIVFSTVGWAIIHLDTLVEWFSDGKEKTTAERKALWKSRLGVVKTYLASLSAGVAFYLLASSVPEWVGLKFGVPEFVILVGAVPAAMGGTVTWEWIAKKFRSRMEM